MIAKFRKWLARKIAPGFIYSLEKRIEKLNKAAIHITVYPKVQIDGLEKLTKPLWLEGNDILMKDSKLEMKERKEAKCMLWLDGNNSTVMNCVFTSKHNKS